jgi:hypothetical protein
MISTQEKIHPDVPTYAEDMGYWHIDAFRSFAAKAISVLRACRSSFAGVGDAEWRDAARSNLLTNKLDPIEIINQAIFSKLKDVAIDKRLS